MKYRAVDQKSQQEGCRTTIETLRKKAGLGCIVGRSKAIEGVRRQIEMLSGYRIGVLICGETGTGKELAARAIHYLSERAGGPFIPVNCGAIPENLFENELFGHMRGAFTDARVLQIGLVQEAKGGTLFLDEIGAISVCNQVKLLRFLQDNEYKRLGDARPHKANVRIVAATNRDLPTLVKEGSFREDLYYRLDVASLRIPSLRERTEDIPLLIEHFLRKYSAEYGKIVEAVSCDAMRELLQYSWPGNIRELENKVQNMILTASGPVIEIADIHLPRPCAAEAIETDGFAGAKRRMVESFERDYLTQLLTRHRGDVAGAAREARKSRTGLWNLIRKHGFSPRDFGDHHLSHMGPEPVTPTDSARHGNVTRE
ncbi:MAG: sigma-54 dependent transcriptional regulator [Phycisphaerales bacterium]